MFYVWMDVDIIGVFFVCADVGPRGQEVELVRVSSHQGPVRTPWGEPREGERRQRDKVGLRPSNDMRAGRDAYLTTLVQGHHRRYMGDVGRDLEDFCHRLEVVLYDVPEGMGSHIQDERVLEKCVGGPAELRTLISREAVVGVVMTTRLPPRPGGPPVGGAPPVDRGPGGGALEAP
jgi:hypothetical protein